MEEQVQVQTPKKGNAGLVVVVILLVVALIGLLGYIGYDKLIANKGNNEPEPVETGVKELTESDVKDYMDRIHIINTKLTSEFPIKDVNDIPNQKLLSIGIYSGLRTSNVIDNYIKYVIGDNVTVKHENFICEYDKYALYNYENNTYSYNEAHPGHGGGGNYVGNAYFKSAMLKGTTITIDTYVVYEMTTDISGPTTSYVDAPNRNAKEVLHNVERENLKAEVEKIKDSLPVTTYTFQRSELGGYNLVSVTIE